MITIHDPKAEPGVPITRYELAIDPSLPGLTIGLVSNGFPDATNLLMAVGRALDGRLHQPIIKLFERRDASVVASAAVIDDVATHCDAAVTAMGHCGSCTSSAVRDSVLVARAGTPSVALVSVKFTELAAFVSRSVGMPDIPRVQLPHPTAGQGEEFIERLAESIADDVVSGLAGVR